MVRVFYLGEHIGFADPATRSGAGDFCKIDIVLDSDPARERRGKGALLPGGL